MRILKVAVTFGGMMASYIHPICHELWCFTAPLIHESRLRKRNHNHTHPVFLGDMLEFVYWELG